MAKTIHQEYDSLSENSVFIETQNFEDDEPTGLPHRQVFYNTETGREMLAEVVSEPILNEILQVWGDKPLDRETLSDGMASLEPPPPTTEEKVLALQDENRLLKAQLQATTDRQDFLEDCVAEMASQVYSV